jgi:hypothetical protein
MPVQSWQWHQHNKGNDAIVTMAHIDDSNNPIATRATMSA